MAKTAGTEASQKSLERLDGRFIRARVLSSRLCAFAPLAAARSPPMPSTRAATSPAVTAYDTSGLDADGDGASICFMGIEHRVKNYAAPGPTAKLPHQQVGHGHFEDAATGDEGPPRRVESSFDTMEIESFAPHGANTGQVCGGA